MKISSSVLLAAGVAAQTPTFFDDFDDLNNWITHVVPNSQNNELQYYTDRDVNVRVEDGYLKLTPLREKYAHRDYTSGKVTSKFHQKFGRFEIRAKHPFGRGLWPAIWMMPQDSVYGGWPASGEIDIFEGRGQNPQDTESTLHYGAIPCCDNHRYTGSGPRNIGVNITNQFHTYRVDWDPKKMTFFFDGQPYWTVSIDKIMQSPFYKEKGQPFDQSFYLILNVAVGGWFLDGPDPWDEFFYPEAEMWVDWVKVYDLNDIEDMPDYDYTCVANPNSSQEDLCGAAQWACYDQNYADMGNVCDADWQNCCQRWNCSHEETVEQCTRVFTQYDSQIHDGSSCDFSGNAIKDWGEGAPTPEPTERPPPGQHGSCQGNPSASNSALCGGMDWACGPHQTWVNLSSECNKRITWGCCWDGGTQCNKSDLLKDADMVYDAYYQAMVTDKPEPTHCDFGGSGILVQ